MTKYDALKKGILYICIQYKEIYSDLPINEKINIKSEIAYWYNKKYCVEFYRHLKKPIVTEYNEKVKEFIWQEYLYAVGL